MYYNKSERSCETVQARRVPSLHARGAAVSLGIWDLDCHGITWPQRWGDVPRLPIIGKRNLKLNMLEQGEVGHISPEQVQLWVYRITLSKALPWTLASTSCHCIFQLPWVVRIFEVLGALSKEDISREVIHIPYKAIYYKCYSSWTSIHLPFWAHLPWYASLYSLLNLQRLNVQGETEVAEWGKGQWGKKGKAKLGVICSWIQQLLCMPITYQAVRIQSTVPSWS